MKLEHLLTPYTKITSKWTKDLNIRPETIKLLNRKNTTDINHSKILYKPPPRLIEIKTKINKWDLIKLQSFGTMKETISKVKRQPSEWVKRQLSEWEKITANETTDNLKNIQAAHAAQYQKNKQPNQKMGQRTK